MGRSLPALTGVLLLLAACASSPPAPIERRTEPGTAPTPVYRVLRGDTLYSIAFRYGLDFRRLAAANGIAPPYTIYAGQGLRLAEAEPPARAAPAKPVPTGPSTAATPSRSSRPSPPPVSRPAPSPATSVQVTPAPATSAPAPKPVTSPSAPAVAAPSPGSWGWPVKGPVLRGFEQDVHKGIDIGGKRGSTINASAAGRVVYAGSGIAGYGLMLIVRHSDEYLSAYGHNDALMVAEGDTVRAGQPIARMGSSGTDTVKLHFELRRNGRPVDPLRLLPLQTR